MAEEQRATLTALSREIRNAEARLQLLQLQREALASEIEALRAENDLLYRDTEAMIKEDRRIQRRLRNIQLEYLMWQQDDVPFAAAETAMYQKQLQMLQEVAAAYPIINEYSDNMWQYVQEMLELTPKEVALPWFQGVEKIMNANQLDKEKKERLFAIWIDTLLSLDYPCQKRVTPPGFTAALTQLLPLLTAEQRRYAQVITNQLENYNVCGRYWYDTVMDFSTRLTNQDIDDDKDDAVVLAEFKEFVTDYYELLQLLG